MWWVAFSIFILIILGGSALFFWRRNRTPQNTSFHSILPKESPFTFLSSKPAPLRRIGILTPVSNRTPELLEEGIKQQLSNGSSRTYIITKGHGNNDRIALFAEACTLLAANDIVVTFGLTCTNIAYEAAAHIKSKTPIIFAGVKQSHLPLIRKKNPDQVLAGLVCQRNYLTQINTLKIIKPSLARVLILYHQQARWLHDEVQDFATFFHSNGVEAATHMLPQVTQIASQIDALKQNIDSIILMPNTLNAKAIGDLVNYCNLQNITLCASELDGVLLGAAIGFGNEEIDQGSHLGRLIRDIIEVKQGQITEIIIDHAEQYQVQLNQRTLASQDILLDDNFVFLLNRGIVSNTTEEQRS